MIERKRPLTKSGKLDRRYGPRIPQTPWRDQPLPFTVGDDVLSEYHAEDFEAAGMTVEKRHGFQGRPSVWLIYLRTGEGKVRDRCCIYRGADRFVVEHRIAGETDMGLPTDHMNLDAAWNEVRCHAFLHEVSYASAASFDLVSAASALPSWLTVPTEV